MQIFYRIIADLLILVFIFVAPWWLLILAIIAAIFFFQNFYESFIFAILLDGFYGVPDISFFGTNAFFTATIGVIFFLSIFLKPRLKFY